MAGCILVNTLQALPLLLWKADKFREQVTFFLLFLFVIN